MPQLQELLSAVRDAYVHFNTLDGPLPPRRQTELRMFLAHAGFDAFGLGFGRAQFPPECSVVSDSLDAAALGSLGSWLTFVSGPLSAAAQSLLVVRHDSAESSGIYAMDAHGYAQADVYKAVRISFRDRTPHWSQLLVCRPTTSEASVLSFLERVRVPSSTLFFVVAPNALPESMANHVQAFVEETFAAPCPNRVIMLFTQECPLRQMISQALSLPTLPTGSDIAFPLPFTKYAQEVFVSKPGDGKSYHIRKLVAARPGRTVVEFRVHEGFSVRQVLKEFVLNAAIMEAQVPVKLTLVFHVSPYAPFLDLDSCLFRLLVLGDVSSSLCGEVFALPRTADVEVLVEVPNPNPKEDHDGSVVRRAKLKRGLGKTTLFEGTVGTSLAGSVKAAGSAVEDGKMGIESISECPCEKCLAAVNVGAPYIPTEGCLHLLPVLRLLGGSLSQIVTVPDAFPLEIEPELQLAAGMLYAFVTPLRGTDRTLRYFVSGVTSMKPETCKKECRLRTIIDAVALSTDGNAVMFSLIKNKGTPTRQDLFVDLTDSQMPVMTYEDLMVRVCGGGVGFPRFELVWVLCHCSESCRKRCPDF